MIKQVEAKEAWKILNSVKDSVLVDVRTEFEWKDGIPNLEAIDKEVKLVTISNNLSEFEEKLQNQLPNQESNIIFICRSGARSDLAAKIAQNQGYDKTYNLAGGFLGWQKMGLAQKIWRRQ